MRPAHVSLQQQYYTVSPSFPNSFLLFHVKRSGGNMISIPAREYNCQHGRACEMHTAGNSCINIYIHFGNTFLHLLVVLPALKCFDDPALCAVQGSAHLYGHIAKWKICHTCHLLALAAALTLLFHIAKTLWE